MTKSYDIFKDDIFSINICQKFLTVFDRQIQECQFFEFLKKMKIKKKAEKEKAVLHNRILNLVKKVKFLDFNDFIEIIENINGIKNYYFRIKGKDLLVTIDTVNNKCISVVSNNPKLASDIAMVYRDFDANVVTKKIGKQLDVRKIKSLDRAMFLENLIAYDSEKIFYNFIAAYVNVVSGKIK